MSFIINSYLFAAGSSYIYIADKYPTDLKAAYSVRKLRESYTGSCVRVRNNSGAEQDIGFDSNNYLDTGSVITFCGVTGSGTVVVWYDQIISGSVARNFTQSAAGAQPLIYSAGTFPLTNGRVGINFDPSRNMVYGSRISAGTSSMVLAVAGTVDTSFAFYGRLSNYGTYIFYVISGSTATAISANVGTPVYFKNESSSFAGTTQGQLYTYLASGSINTQYIWSIRNINFNTALDVQILGGGGGGVIYSGSLQELLIYSSGSEAVRPNIVSDINTYFTTY